jgi:hypothetical protein
VIYFRTLQGCCVCFASVVVVVTGGGSSHMSISTLRILALSNSPVALYYLFTITALNTLTLLSALFSPPPVSVFPHITTIPTTSLGMQRSARTPAFFRNSQMAFRSLRWKPKWTPPPHFVALMNEDEDLDVVVLSTFDSLTVCCHEDLLKMPINGLLRLIVDLNSRLSAAMKITDTLTKSEDRLRMDIEAVLGYKRTSPTELQTLAAASRDSGLGLLGLFSATQAPEAQATPLTPPRPRRKDSNHSLSDRQRLTVSMLGKPRLEDLKEEEPEARNPRRPVEKSPIRRSGRQHSLAQGRRDRAGEATTLPRARSLRNFQTYEERRVRPYPPCLRAIK